MQLTVQNFQTFLLEIARNSGASKIHVIAHSMGNRALTVALREISMNPAMSTINDKLNEIILTAPDIRKELFKQHANDIRKMGKRLTLYVSSKDMALFMSEWFHDYPRAGDSSEEVVVVPGIDTIDVSPLDTSLIGHSYYGDIRALFTDMFVLLEGKKKTGERYGLDPKTNQAGLPYWSFRR